MHASRSRSKAGRRSSSSRTAWRRRSQQAEAAADGKDVVLAGGASIVQQALRLDAVDEVGVSVAPVLLGGGTRLLEGLPQMQLELVEAVDAPGVAHLRYRVRK